MSSINDPNMEQEFFECVFVKKVFTIEQMHGLDGPSFLGPKSGKEVFVNCYISRI